MNYPSWKARDYILNRHVALTGFVLKINDQQRKKD